MTTATFLTATSRRRTAHDAVTDHLCRHLQQCHVARGRWFGAAMLAERIHFMVAPRFATTVALAAVLLAIACSLL